MTRDATQAPRLRPAAAADRDLLLEIFASTRTRELALLGGGDERRRWFVNSQFAAQETHYHRVHPSASFDVVLVGEERAGRLYVDRQPREIRIVDIALLPKFRGGGIGAQLIETLIAEAASTGRALTLRVEAQNPARHLYERLGFRYVQDDALYLSMEWTPK